MPETKLTPEARRSFYHGAPLLYSEKYKCRSRCSNTQRLYARKGAQRMDNIPLGYCHCGCGQRTRLARQTDKRKGWVKGRPVRYISGHFRWGNSEHLDIDAQTKFCKTCQQWKPLTAFHKNKPQAGGVDHRCAECKRRRVAELAADPDQKLKVYFRTIERTYGLSRQEYERMEQEQDGRCAICGRNPGVEFANTARWLRRLHVDHTPNTRGDVRGLLCYHCNIGLGSLGDSPSRLQAAKAYLERHATKRGENAPD